MKALESGPVRPHLSAIAKNWLAKLESELPLVFIEKRKLLDVTAYNNKPKRFLERLYFNEGDTSL
jgi:hypothetical protein